MGNRDLQQLFGRTRKVVLDKGGKIALAEMNAEGLIVFQYGWFFAGIDPDYRHDVIMSETEKVYSTPKGFDWASFALLVAKSGDLVGSARAFGLQKLFDRSELEPAV